jgi:hypothetical protein
MDRALIDRFRQGTTHLRAMAEKLEHPWSPEESHPQRMHNSYVRNLVTCYVSKVAQLSDAVLQAWEHEQFLMYALSGRAMIETVATLRYYVVAQYKPLLDRGIRTDADMKSLIDIDDRHLRGGRFDWRSFFSKEYEKLKADAVKQLATKKAKQKYLVENIAAEQVNVLTCIEKWAEEQPDVLIAYNLFSDLVHPNIGSTFLVASTSQSGLYFAQGKGVSVGAQIFDHTFPLLIAVTHKPFSTYLTLLMATMWKDDEIV